MLLNESVEAMDAERSQNKIVKDYLDGLEKHKAKRGRKRSPETIKKRLNVIEAKLPTVSSLTKLHLIQEKLDLEATLKALEAPKNVDDLEPIFIQVARAYSEKHNISYSAWRAMGVRSETLKRAGIYEN